jgi:hypothetical protein
VELGTSERVVRSGETVGRILHRKHDPNNGDNQIDILIDPDLPKGSWKVELLNRSSHEVPFHAWIERDDWGQSQFSLADHDPSHTIGSISCGTKTIAVGSYEASDPVRALSYFTAEGPTRDGKKKPEVSAPGHEILAARSLTQTTIRKSGTSMATPHVTGLVALVLQAAANREVEVGVEVDELRTLLSQTARKGPPTDCGWDPRYGAGRLDAAAAVARQFPPGALPPALGTNGTAGTGAVSIHDLVAGVVNGSPQPGARFRIQIEVETPAEQP